MKLTEESITALQDLDFFASNFFKLRSKDGSIVDFKFNRAQQFLHKRLQAQLDCSGKVRAVVLKGRQQGVSTYTQARYFHKTITSAGFRTYILTHETEATKNLFGITKRYYDYLPPGLCPKADRDTQEELIFDKTLGSSYGVGTARNRGAGRSQTIQLLHGSEVAFWEHAQEHATGLLQAVGNSAGTEIILESTANGIGNYFYNMWRQASSGESEWQAIFLPWYWQDEYRDFTPGFNCSAEELELLERYGADGLTKEHLAWRRKKIADFGYDWDAGVAEFKQEFPFNANEAFRNPVEDVFITASHVQRARKASVDSQSSLVIGVDPAIGERDRCVIVRRKGRLVYNVEILTNHNTMELAGRLKHIIEKESPLKVFVDPIGIGAGTVDRLQEMGFSSVVGVDVRRTANDKVRFGNLRAELWWEMRDWLYQADLPVQIPDSDELEIDLCSLGYKYRSNGQLLIESKEDAKARGLRSPDLADALMMTFAEGQMVGRTSFTPNFIPAHHHKMFI